MADATPVNKASEGAAPSPAEERLMVAAGVKQKADPKELKAMLDAALKDGKKAQIVSGNAIRVDN